MAWYNPFVSPHELLCLAVDFVGQATITFDDLLPGKRTVAARLRTLRLNAASSVGITMVLLDAHTEGDIDGAFKSAVQDQAP